MSSVSIAIDILGKSIVTEDRTLSVATSESIEMISRPSMGKSQSGFCAMAGRVTYFVPEPTKYSIEIESFANPTLVTVQELNVATIGSLTL